MAYNVFPYSAVVEAPFYFVLGHKAFMAILFKLLLAKLRYMSNDICKPDLEAMREMCMMAARNFKIARDKCPSPTWDPDKMACKVGDMVSLKNHAPTSAFATKYKPSLKICKWTSDKAFHIQDDAGKVRCTSIQHLQLLHPAEHVLTHLPNKTSFGRTMKYINHPNISLTYQPLWNAQKEQIKGKTSW